MLDHLQQLYRLQQCTFGQLDVMIDPKTTVRYLCHLIQEEEYKLLDKSFPGLFDQYMKVVREPPHCENMLVPLEYGISEDKTKYVIYPYCNGRTLYDTLEQAGKSFSEEVTKDMVSQIVRFFYSSERRGGCHHHDLKLENLFLHDKKVLVGGLLLSEWGNEFSTKLCGSICNMAPEVHEIMAEAPRFCQIRPYTRKADIYSIGLLTLELLTNGNIFGSTQEEEIIETMVLSDRLLYTKVKIVRSTLKSLKYSLKDQGFYRVLKTMLDPDPDLRCNFNFLYEYFGFRKVPEPSKLSIQISMGGRGVPASADSWVNSIKPEGSTRPVSKIEDEDVDDLADDDAYGFDKYLDIFNDSSLLRVHMTRQLYFKRLNHEYYTIQFIMYASKHLWMMSTSELHQVELERELSLHMKLLSCAILTKSSMIRQNLLNSVRNNVNIFLIKEFDEYINHPVFKSDKSYINNFMESDFGANCLEFIQAAKDFLNISFEEYSKETEQLRLFDSFRGSKAERLDYLNSIISEQSKLIENRMRRSHEYSFFFKNHLNSLIRDCRSEQEIFRFVDPFNGIFDWDQYISTNYNGYLTNLVFKSFSTSEGSDDN